MTATDRIRPLLGYLDSLIGEERLDRGALAALRRGAGKRPASAPEMFPLVEPRLPEDASERESDAAYRVAALFALHHQGSSLLLRFGEGEAGQRWQDRTFGASLRMAARGDDGSLDTSIERRFLALLDAKKADIDPHLRNLFTLIKARKADTPIDYLQLYNDLLAWDHPDRYVQKRWAQGFWRGSAAPTADATETAADESDGSDSERDLS